jgi:hypothetical protein
MATGDRSARADRDARIALRFRMTPRTSALALRFRMTSRYCAPTKKLLIFFATL